MSLGVFGQFVRDCRAAAQTVPLINQQKVFIGHYEWLAQQEFYQELAHNGFELFIGAPIGSADNVKLEGEFTSEAELFFTIPADRPSNLMPMMAVISQLNVAWSTMFQRWCDGGNRNPLKISWGEIKIRTHEKPFVCSVTFKLSSAFIVDQASEPFLNPAATEIVDQDDGFDDAYVLDTEGNPILDQGA